MRRRTLPRRSSEGEGRLVSSRNLKAGTSRSEAGVARETRRCLVPEEEGKGAVKEKVEVCVVRVVAIVSWGERRGKERGLYVVGISINIKTRVSLTSFLLTLDRPWPPFSCGGPPSRYSFSPASLHPCASSSSPPSSLHLVKNRHLSPPSSDPSRSA